MRPLSSASDDMLLNKSQNDNSLSCTVAIKASVGAVKSYYI